MSRTMSFPTSGVVPVSATIDHPSRCRPTGSFRPLLRKEHIMRWGQFLEPRGHYNRNLASGQIAPCKVSIVASICRWVLRRVQSFESSASSASDPQAEPEQVGSAAVRPHAAHLNAPEESVFPCRVRTRADPLRNSAVAWVLPRWNDSALLGTGRGVCGSSGGALQGCVLACLTHTRRRCLIGPDLVAVRLLFLRLIRGMQDAMRFFPRSGGFVPLSSGRSCPVGHSHRRCGHGFRHLLNSESR